MFPPKVGDLVLEEQPAVLGPRQLSPVCCLGCCLPLRYADITWYKHSMLAVIVVIKNIVLPCFPVSHHLLWPIKINSEQVPRVQLAPLQSLMSWQRGDPQVGIGR